MPSKNISVDREAYELLLADKREGESFSKVIKRHFQLSHPRTKKTARNLLKHLHEIALSEETLDNVDRIIAERR